MAFESFKKSFMGRNAPGAAGGAAGAVGAAPGAALGAALAGGAAGVGGVCAWATDKSHALKQAADRGASLKEGVLKLIMRLP